MIKIMTKTQSQQQQPIFALFNNISVWKYLTFHTVSQTRYNKKNNNNNNNIIIEIITIIVQ